MTWINIRDNQLTGWNLFAAFHAHSSCTFCIAQNFVDKRVRADFSAMGSQIFSERERDAVHTAFDQIVADVLQY